MAKKKNANTKNAQVKKVEPMKKKVEVKPIESNEKASKIVGTIFVGLGVLLVAFGIYSFFQFRTDPQFDESLDIPKLEYVTEVNNTEEILVKGFAPGYDTVAIFLDDERVGETKVEDEAYEYTLEVEGEGEYNVSVAGLKGFPIRKISGRSESMVAVIDMTPPSQNDVKFVYGSETNKETFVLSGNVEPNISIEVKRGIDMYIGQSDDEGFFRIENIALEEGRNVFTIDLSDQAGNTTRVDEKVRVEFIPGSAISGDAVADEFARESGKEVAGEGDTIPQASGTLDSYMITRLMLIFGILAFLGFSSSSIYAFSKKR